MPSPFPGMNPYLEQDDAWHDFHEKLIPAIAEALVAQVRPHYIVKIDEHVYVHEQPPEPTRRLLGKADVGLAVARVNTGAVPMTGLLEPPMRVQVPVMDVERLGYVEIRDRKSRDLITVIEVLSPSNKRSGADRDQYLSKRRELLDSRVHLVEIDLLRGGKPMPLDDRVECAYSVLVSRAEERPAAGFWALGLQDRLPTIRIPLREPGTAELDLQTLLHRVYDASGYEDYIYTGSPDPALSSADRAWAETLVPNQDLDPAG